MNVPNSDMAPHAAHMIKLRPIDPVLMRSPLGETNIPEPVYKLLQSNVNCIYFFFNFNIFNIKQYSCFYKTFEICHYGVGQFAMFVRKTVFVQNQRTI